MLRSFDAIQYAHSHRAFAPGKFSLRVTLYFFGMPIAVRLGHPLGQVFLQKDVKPKSRVTKGESATDLVEPKKNGRRSQQHRDLMLNQLHRGVSRKCSFTEEDEEDNPAIPAHGSLGKQAFSCYSAEFKGSVVRGGINFCVPQTTAAPMYVDAGLLPVASVIEHGDSTNLRFSESLRILPRIGTTRHRNLSKLGFHPF